MVAGTHDILSFSYRESKHDHCQILFRFLYHLPFLSINSLKWTEEKRAKHRQGKFLKKYWFVKLVIFLIILRYLGSTYILVYT